VVRTFLRWFVVSVVAAVGVPLVAVTTIVGSLIFLPLPATLPDPKPGFVSLPSQVFDAAGNPIATFRAFDQSVPIKQSDVPQVLKNALVASEDKNFYHEGGVDPRGTVRALVRDLQGSGYVQGGSTITQQYVKMAYTDQKRTLTRKLKEAVLASQLSRKVPKDEILFKYLNAVYLGDGAYGVGAASETYFRKPVTELNASEAALLVGLIPAPSRYEPRANTALAEQRRLTVLQKMWEQHDLSDADYLHWKATPVRVAVGGLAFGLPPSTIVYPPLDAVTRYPYFVDYVRRYLEIQPGIGPDVLYRGGLKIQTTIDPTLQAAAEQAVATSLQGTADPLEMSLVSIEPQTGHVRALVGGRDFAKDQTNLALGGCDNEAPDKVVPVVATCVRGGVPQGGGTGRQPGSAFKPFVLAAAFTNGVLPTEPISGPPSIALPKGCTSGCAVIHNAEAGEGGSFTVASATWASVNTAYAQLILDPRVGVRRTAQVAKDVGITNAWYSPSRHGASYALGALDVSPLDMASAYGVFDNHGVRAPPTPVIRIVDASGRTLLDDSAPPGTQVLDSAVADNVTEVLKGVITQGTGYPNAVIGRPAAGKTGTTSNFVDGWFVGYVPTLSTSVWMGFKDSEDAAKHQLVGFFPGRGYRGQIFGGTVPALTWADFMMKATVGVPPTDFSQPAPLRPVANALKPGPPRGVTPGPARSPVSVGAGGPYLVPAPPPVAAPPPTTVPAATTTTAPPPTTTTLSPPATVPP